MLKKHSLEIAIRVSKLSDLTEMLKMFVDTISTVCKNDFTPEQINVWISSIENRQRWIDKLNSQYFLIAEFDHKIVGFASLEDNDYIDLLYVHKDFQRQGIADGLFAEIEKEAIKRKAAYLYSDVSKTAIPFFEKKGFKILAPKINLIKDVEIVNYKMSRKL